MVNGRRALAVRDCYHEVSAESACWSGEALLLTAVETWQFTAAAMVAEQLLLGEAMRCFLHSKSFIVWNQWRSWAAEMRRKQFALRGALVRMRNRLLSMAFVKWQYEAREMKHQQRLLGGALVVMRHRQLSMA